MFPRFLLALAASALLCGAAAPASHGVAIELLPEVVLDQPHIALADVAYVHAEQADSAALAHVDLGSVPRVGYVERFDRAQLETAIRQQTGMRAPALHWSGAAAVAVRTKTHPMLAQALVDAALAAVNAEFTRRHLHAEASVTTPPGDIELPAGDWQLRARSLHDTAVGARLPVWIDVLVDGTPYRSLVVPVAVIARAEVYVARHTMASGMRPVPADFDRVEQDIAGTAVPVLDAGELANTRLRHAVPAGQRLERAALVSTEAVLRGEHVRLTVQAGPIGIETDAVALADGMRGQQVSVRPLNSNETVVGRVVAAGTVSLE